VYVCTYSQPDAVAYSQTELETDADTLTRAPGLTDAAALTHAPALTHALTHAPALASLCLAAPRCSLTQQMAQRADSWHGGGGVTGIKGSARECDRRQGPC